MLAWHRLFGVLMVDHCTDSCVEVRLEEDYSKVEQILDCALLRRRDDRPLPVLPDGFSPLAAHTLVSFKSYRESFDRFALEELIGHSVAYRKFEGDGKGGPLDAQHLKLIALSGRRPAWLDYATLHFTNQQPGVYNGEYGLTPLTVVVPRELAATSHNASLLLLSGDPGCVTQSWRLLRLKNPALGTELISSVYRQYGEEGIRMAYTVEQFRQDARREMLAECTVEERLRGVASEELVRWLPVEERLKGLAVEERLKGLSRTELLGMSAQMREQLLAILLSPDAQQNSD